MKTRTVFVDPAHDSDFEHKGYVMLDLLAEADVAELLNLFGSHGDEIGTGAFHTSHFSTDKAYKKHVHDTVSRVVFSRLEPFLQSYRPVFGNFMVKQPDPDVFMPLHADWTYVDESMYRSGAVWIPLVDTDLTNGSFGIIEGSHKFMNAVRGPNIKQSDSNNDKYWVQQYGKLLPLKKGQAIVYDHGLMHFSPPNKSGQVRPALNLSMVPVESEVIHYCVPAGDAEIAMYKVLSDDFFIHYTHFGRPEADTLIRKMPLDSVPRIDARMEKYRTPSVPSGWKKLVQFFK